jgi:hypothetical protein
MTDIAVYYAFADNERKLFHSYIIDNAWQHNFYNRAVDYIGGECRLFINNKMIITANAQVGNDVEQIYGDLEYFVKKDVALVAGYTQSKNNDVFLGNINYNETFVGIKWYFGDEIERTQPGKSILLPVAYPKIIQEHEIIALGKNNNDASARLKDEKGPQIVITDISQSTNGNNLSVSPILQLAPDAKPLPPGEWISLFTSIVHLRGKIIDCANKTITPYEEIKEVKSWNLGTQPAAAFNIPENFRIVSIEVTSDATWHRIISNKNGEKETKDIGSTANKMFNLDTGENPCTSDPGDSQALIFRQAFAF